MGEEHLYDELKRLKKENARLEEERDSLKRLRHTSRRKAPEVRVYPTTSRTIQDPSDVPGPGGFTKRLLCMVPTS